MFAEAIVRRKHIARYFACDHCDFIQVEDPAWLKEAYAEPINRSDVGYVARNTYLAKVTKAVIERYFNSDARFVDYGGGYGMFVRLMRDAGYDFFRSDKYCQNLFAIDFEAELTGADQYELVTSFEVFEHLLDPMAEMERMFSYSRSILFSTELQPQHKPTLEGWSYYALDHGQHIAFYSLKTLQEIAARFNRHLYSDGLSIHLFTDKKISPFVFRTIVNRKVATILNYIIRRLSLTPADYNRIITEQRSR